jgi:hypothetical protein
LDATKVCFLIFIPKEPKFSKHGCYQSKDSKLSESQMKDIFSEFGVLKWFLTNRLSTCLRKNWIKKKELLEKVEKFSNSFIYDPSTIDLTIENSKKENKIESTLEVFNQQIEFGENENLFSSSYFSFKFYFSQWKHLYWNCFFFKQKNCNMFK